MKYSSAELAEKVEKKTAQFLKMSESGKESAQAKLRLLVHGVQDNPVLFGEYERIVKEEHYAYDNGNWGVDKKRLVPTELFLPGGIVSKLHIRPESPLALRKDADNNIYLTEGQKVLSEVTFLQRPKFWEFTTTRKIPTKSVAQIYGFNALNFNIFSGCEFHDKGKACAFCSVKKTVGKDSPIEIEKNITDLEDVCSLVTEHDKIEYVIMTGGSYINRETEFERNVSIVEKIRHRLPWNGIVKGNVSFLPPKDINKLEAVLT